MPRGEIVLEPPPEIPEVPGDALQQMLTYLPMLAMTFGMVAMMSGTGSGALRWVGGGALGLGMGGMALGQMARGRGDRKLKLNGLRRDYLRYLGQVRRKVRRVAAAQREALDWASPEPGELRWLAAGSELARLWERRPVRRRLRQRPGRHRHAAPRRPAHPAADQAGRGPGPAVRRRAAPVRPGARHGCPTCRSRISLRAFAGSALSGDAEARGRHGPGDDRPARGLPLAGRRCGSACAPRRSGIARLGMGQVAAARPAPDRARRGRPGPPDGARPWRELEAMLGAEFAEPCPGSTPGKADCRDCRTTW